MAATNYTPISLYYSSTATNTPSAGNLVFGELAINIADGKLFYKNPSNVVTLLAVAGGAITPITNNGVVYVNSSGQAVSGSALTFDGTTLSSAAVSYKGSTSGTVTLTAPAVAGTQSYTLPTAVPAANGYALTSTTAGVMSWAAQTAPGGSTTQVQYNSSGSFAGSANLVFDGTNLGIGVASPAVPLEIDKNSGEALRLAATGANQSIYSRYIAGSPNTGNLYVGVDTATGAISGTSGGGLLWQNGNNPLAFGTNNALAMTLTQSGTLILKGGSSSATNVGITFPATQVASSDVNTLDDYEEGTFTPTIDSSTAGSGRATTVSYAAYTKVGRSVSVVMFLTLGTLGTGGSGNLVINGLPFTSANYTGFSCGYFVGLNSVLSSVSGYVTTGTTTISVTGAATTSTDPLATITFATYAKAGMSLMISGTYFIS